MDLANSTDQLRSNDQAVSDLADLIPGPHMREAVTRYLASPDGKATFQKLGDPDGVVKSLMSEFFALMRIGRPRALTPAARLHANPQFIETEVRRASRRLAAFWADFLLLASRTGGKPPGELLPLYRNLEPQLPEPQMSQWLAGRDRALRTLLLSLPLTAADARSLLTDLADNVWRTAKNHRTVILPSRAEVVVSSGDAFLRSGTN